MNPYSSAHSDTEDTLRGTSTVNFWSNMTQASLLENYGLKVREFIILSFLSDQGPMDVEQLSRVVNVDQRSLLESIERLAATGLVLPRPDMRHASDSFVILTALGHEIASLIGDQL